MTGPLQPRGRCVHTLLAILLTTIAAGAQQGHERLRHDLARSLSRWHVAWQRGAIELREPATRGRRLHPVYVGRALRLRTKEDVDHREALRRMLKAVPDHAEDPEVLRGALALASIGLEGDAEAERGAATVRGMARTALSGIEQPRAIHLLMRLARGDRRAVRGGGDDALRLAAILTLGDLDVPVGRLVLQRQLDDDERLVRLAATEGLLTHSAAHAVPALADALERESDPLVAQMLVLTLHRTLSAQAAAVGAAETQRALSTALDVVGRHDWRTDLAVVDLGVALRSTATIPVLIDVLADTADRLDEPGIGLLRDRALGALRELTGAALPADAAAWREFWGEVRADFRMPPPRSARSHGGSTSSAFFGIPVHGRRVLFIIDRSGSMGSKHQPLPVGEHTASREREAATRLAWAKHELMEAVQHLPPGARFDVVIFSSKVRRWRGEMIPANPRTRRMLRDHLGGVRAGGGTNIWGALEAALELRALTWGDPEPPAIDEVFLLSDGQPSTGSLTDPNAIVNEVAELNRLRRVRIHTVYMGPRDSAFMQRLADANHGRYVRTGR